AIAVVLALLLKVVLLAQLGSLGVAVVCTSVFLAHVVSRTWPLLMIRLLPHVGDAAGSKSKPLADQITVGALLAAFFWCFLALAPVWIAYPAIKGVAIGVALAFTAVAFGVMLRWFRRRLGGFTGDCLGATQQVCELAFYLGMAVGWGLSA
ncbi:MAG TPA: adenosylcobinamide-GDP ribazoletransferase, partial [Rhodoferax sp.]|nr:adenosylcobinamide-GDP ribazoletransferase [Rhodoferax sp.]